MVLAIVSFILLDRIFKEISNKELNNINIDPDYYESMFYFKYSFVLYRYFIDSKFFVFLYETNLIDGSSLTIKNLYTLEKTVNILFDSLFEILFSTFDF